MCRLNCVGEEKSEYINVGVKKWLKKTAFRCKKVEAKKGYRQLYYRKSKKYLSMAPTAPPLAGTTNVLSQTGRTSREK